MSHSDLFRMLLSLEKRTSLWRIPTCNLECALSNFGICLRVFWSVHSIILAYASSYFAVCGVEFWPMIYICCSLLAPTFEKFLCGLT